MRPRYTRIMKRTIGFATAGGLILLAAVSFAEEAAEQTSLTRGSSHDAVEQPANGAAVNSRGGTNPTPTPATPAARTSSAKSSRGEPSSLQRSTIQDVVRDTSHIVVQSDTSPVFYRFTKATQFVDERG